MKPINIIWYDGFFGCWDHGLLASIFNSDSSFIQHNTIDRLVFDEAIIIMGKPKDLSGVREHLDKFKRGIVILASDEDSLWDWKSVIPPQFEVWTQYYYQENKHEIKERLLLGFPTRLSDVTINLTQARKYLCSFVGQVQNQHRKNCVKALEKIPNHFIKVASGFGGVNGLEYQDYVNILTQSKVVLCPSGSMCADSFRVYEALECGTLPIVEPRSPRDPENFNYWETVGADILPCIHDWNDIVYLLKDERLIELKTYHCLTWWASYKQTIKTRLVKSF